MASIRFQCLRGALEGQTFEFYSRVVLGRDRGCDLTIEDATCSRSHAVIETLVDRYEITDVGSRNGVRVNGERVMDASLHYGDQFQIGRNLFIFLSELFGKVESKNAFPYDVETLDVEAVEQRHTTDLYEDIEELRAEQELDTNESLEPQGRRKDFTFLYGLSRELSGMLETDAIIETVTHRVFDRLARAERVSCFLFESDPPSLKEVRVHARIPVSNAPVSRTILDHVQRERLGIRCEDALGFARSQSICTSRLRSFMCIPLIARKTLLGIVYVDSLSRRCAFSRSDFELLTLVGNLFASTLANALAYVQSQKAHLDTVRSLGNALEAKDSYTRGHSERVATYAVGIGKHLGLSFERVQYLRLAAELHDIGKIAMKDSLLGKEGRLTQEEFEQTREHPAAGIEILRPIEFLQPVLPFILHHHERYDGSGYPDGLKGEEIPLEARIINLADAFDAMTTQRAYNKPIDLEEAIARCKREEGVSFDPNCVRALLSHLREAELTSSTMSLRSDAPLQALLFSVDLQQQEEAAK